MDVFPHSIPAFMIATLVALGLGGSASQAEPGSQPETPDALIGTSENIRDHEGAYEDIHGHEGRSEDIHHHEGTSRSLDGMSVRAEKLSDHHADSETLKGRVVQSERLHGMGHEIKSSSERLDEARARLAAARARHATKMRPAPAATAAAPAAPASAGVNSAPYEHWTARIDVERPRIAVAEAALTVWDEYYARMIQSDYPRGEARQKLIDSRNAARERVEAEQARLPRMVEEARKAGVPPGVLELHSSSQADD